MIIDTFSDNIFSLDSKNYKVFAGGRIKILNKNMLFHFIFQTVMEHKHQHGLYDLV